jgi:hypothetical protein
MQQGLFEEEEAEALDIENMERKIAGQPQVTTITGLEGGPKVIIEEKKETTPEPVKITFPGGGEVTITPSGDGINVQFSHISADNIDAKHITADFFYASNITSSGMGSFGSVIVNGNSTLNNVDAHDINAHNVEADTVKLTGGYTSAYYPTDEGLIQFDKSDKHFKGWNGSHWVTFG